MSTLQSQLKTVSRSLTALSKQVEKLSNQVQKPKTVKKAAAKKPVAAKKRVAAKKTVAKKVAAAGGKTVLDTVFDVIKRSKKGVSVAQLKTKTQLDARQLSNALYKLSKKGMVKAPSRGLYLKK
jgi:predicted Rossmann fold nucleotide-binding protein DprA/Smf involved in DNA uptake